MNLSYNFLKGCRCIVTESGSKSFSRGRRWKLQKQPSRGVPRKKCSENVQQIYRRTLMPKCDFNKVAKQLH